MIVSGLMHAALLPVATLNRRVRSKRNKGSQSHAWIVMAAWLGLSCGGALPRQTTATDTRADDPWLESGERCSAGSEDDPGLRIEELEAGTGKAVGDGEEVRVHYVARLPDGTIIHDTRRWGADRDLHREHEDHLRV